MIFASQTSVSLQLCLNRAPLTTYHHLNLKRSHDSEHTPFGDIVLCVHEHSPASISTLNLMCLASPIPNVWLGAKFEKKRVTWPWPHPLGSSLSSQIYWYILPAYTRFGDSLKPFWRYDCWRQNWKWITWLWPRAFYGWFFIHISQDMI